MTLTDTPPQALLAPMDTSGDIHFDVTVNPNGYRWWYVDAFSEDGRCGMTLIIFIGCVFSPYYVRARRKKQANPWDFCSVNAIFYGPDRKRWSLTERDQTAVTVTPSCFQIGPSAITRTTSGLHIALDEICVPIPSRITGHVDVFFPNMTQQCFALDAAEQHRWWPIAPCADVRVELQKPNLQWSGRGYVDSNGGTVPLESTFRGWHWTRTEPKLGLGQIFYNRQFWDGSSSGFTITYDEANSLNVDQGRADATPLPATPIWRCSRPVVSSDPRARVVKTFEDTPFYARSKLALEQQGELVHAMHEYVDLARFKRRWVQTLLPFRMPRRTG